MSGQNPVLNYVLTAIDTAGDTTWTSAGGVSGWTITNTNDVYETGQGNVGIGTTITNAGAALSVMNGNVGIGTWKPSSVFMIGNNAFAINAAGTITATTGITTTGAYTQSGANANAFTGLTAFNAAGTSATFTGNVGIGTTTPAGSLAIMNGNVGIGTWVPAVSLDVNGTIRTVNFTMSGQVPLLNYVLTAIDTSGDTTWSSPGGISGWTITNVTDLYQTFGGNVGIGTTITNAGAALSVMNGNVGIGTWKPSAALAIGNNAFVVNSSGAITATTGITTTGAYTQSGAGANTLTGQTAFNAAGTSA